jgi:hypothetical protein
METDASNFVIAGIVSQYDDEGILHPVTYLSRKYLPADINCEIYNKKLFVIIYAFKVWLLLLKNYLMPLRSSQIVGM